LTGGDWAAVLATIAGIAVAIALASKTSRIRRLYFCLAACMIVAVLSIGAIHLFGTGSNEAQAPPASAENKSNTSESNPPTSSTSSPPTYPRLEITSRPAEPAPTVRRGGRITLEGTTAVDLDATESENPEWEGRFSENQELYFDGEDTWPYAYDLRVYGGAEISADVRDAGSSLDACRRATRHQEWRYDDYVDPGTSWCAKTDEDRDAVITLIENNEDSIHPTAIIQVRVFERSEPR
jgi:hypothetical protein